MRKYYIPFFLIFSLVFITSCSKSNDEILTIPSPPIVLSQSICEGENSSNLQVQSGTNLKWYLNEEGGNFLPTDYQLTTGTYFCSQTSNGIESLRTKVEITVVPCVTIGTQTWMQKNLDVDHYRNGDPIPEQVYPTWWEILYPENGLWCHYHNDPAYGMIYGKLYNFLALRDSRELAPRGFHIPKQQEWETLFEYIGGIEVGSKPLRSATGWDDNSNPAGANSTGFTALPGGWRWSDGTYNGEGGGGYWWCELQNNFGDFNYAVRMYVSGISLTITTFNIHSGLSVRCIRD